MAEQRDLKTILVANLDLSNRAKNALGRRGIDTVDKMMELTGEELSSFRNLGAKTIAEILDLIDSINDGAEVPEKMSEQQTRTKENNWSSGDRRNEFDEHIEQLYQYVDENDITLTGMGLSRRAMNRLQTAGCTMFSDVVRMSDIDLVNLPSMGKKSINEVKTWINDYITKHEARIQAFIEGDESVLWDDQMISQKILDLYADLGFGGLSYVEMVVLLKLPVFINEDRLKKVIGRLIAEHELEYVDFRCYRVYAKFVDCLQKCTAVDERERDFINKRLQNYSLEAIAQENGITRERVRQVVKNGREKVRFWYLQESGSSFFDEDYYGYLYAQYSFNKSDAADWFGIPEYVWNYLKMYDMKQGDKDIRNAYTDQNLDLGLRLKIKGYLNRNKLFVDGKWVEKRRSELEDVLARRLCVEDISFNEFANKYNSFLREEEIPFDEDVYYTESVIRTRKNKLMESRYLLWKQNEQIRYYDIDARDYEELLDVLNLDAYENVELSTTKFIEEYPEIMAQYDIRDQYELHNLLRKITKGDSEKGIIFGRMPTIKFGSFDRNAAILEIMSNNAPISQEKLVDLVHDEYGYDQATIIGSYLIPFKKYLVNGFYTMDQKKMDPEHINLLSQALSDDFYYIDEIKRIYQDIVPEADLEEINQYNLNEMGFSVYARYALQNYSTLEGYFQSLLLAEDIIDISKYRRRFCYVQSFSIVLTELKKNLDIVEFEPNVVISFRKLERGGLTREMVEDFCDAIYDFMDNNTFFSATSLKVSGFDSELFDFGFSDWFYANLLISDERFSHGNMFGTIMFYKGDMTVTRKSFLEDRVLCSESIDVYDLLSEMTDVYGCRLKEDDRYDIVRMLRETTVYYDDTLDRFYENEEAFYNDFERSIN